MHASTSALRPVLAAMLAALLLVSLVQPTAARAEEASAAAATYSFDFKDVEPGSAPEGWSSLWTTPSAVVQSNPPRLVFSGTVSGRQILSPDVVGTVSGDVEISALVRSPEDPQTRFGVWLHASGPIDSENGYYVDYRTDGNGNRLRLNRYSAGAFLINSATTDGVVPPPNPTQWYQVVLRRQGTTNYAKMWPYGTEEPAAWQVSTSNTLFSSGRVGIGHPTGATVEFAHVGVGTGGESAPRAPAGIIPDPQVPDAPEVAVEAHEYWLSARWDDVPGADWYEVERDGTVVAQDWRLSGYLDPVVGPGQTASYRVRGVSSVEGPGEWSEPVTATRPGRRFPDRLTPFETSDGATLTTYEQEQEFLGEVAAASPRVALTEIGRTNQGRAIQMVRIGHPVAPTEEEAAQQPAMLIVCSIHGNEVTPREACLRLVRDLAFGADEDVARWLDGRNLLIIPNPNADGRAANTRGNADGIDVNRDYIAAETPEGRALVSVVATYEPQVIVDGHHCCSEALVPLWTRNLNMHEPLRALARSLVQDEIRGVGAETGLTHALYNSGGDEGILRNYGGLRHAASILVETAGGAIPGRVEEASGPRVTGNRRLRGAAAQTFAIETTLDWWIDNTEELDETIRDAQEAAEANEGPVYLGGADNSPPGPGQVLDPAPCGYFITDTQWEDPSIRARLELHRISYDEDAIEGGVLVPLAQRARNVIPLLVDGAATRSIVSALRLSDCDDPGGQTLQYAYDFTEQEPGQAPEGWREIWRPGSWTVAADPARLEHRITDATAGRQVLAPEELVDVSGDLELSAVFRVPQLGPSTRFQLWLRATGEPGSETGYYADVQGNNLRLNRLDNGTFVAGSSTNFGGLTPGAFYELLVERVGTTHRAKLWPYGTPEPASWMVTSSPGAPVASGAIGFGHFDTGANVDWVHLGVGLAGLPAPRIAPGILPLPSPPAAPEVTATARDTYIRLSWEDDIDAATWEVQRRPAGGGSSDWVNVGRDIPTTSFADVAGVEPGGTYEWRVRGVSLTEGPGDWSEPATATLPALPTELVTGFEARGGASWTTYDEELAFTAAVAAASERVRVEVLGQSVQGRNLQLVTIGHPAPRSMEEIRDGQSILVGCSVHGNEPAPREGCLQLIRKLATDTSPEMTEFLSEHDVLVIPSVNPDGRAANTRGNARGTDLNRDYMALAQPESRLILEVLRDYDVDVAVDAHECCTSTGSSPDVELLYPTNPSNVENVAELGRELVEDRLFGHLTAEGFARGHYPGGDTENILRNHTGVKAHVGLLIETHRAPQRLRAFEIGKTENDPGVRRRRVASQLATMDDVLSWYAERADAIDEARAEALAEALANRGDVRFPNGQVLDPAVCGYELSASQYTQRVAGVLESQGVQAYEDGNRVLVPLAQRYRRIVPLLLDARASFTLAAGTPLTECPVTFDEVRTRLDAVSAAGGITPALEEKVRHALDQTELWLTLPKQRAIAVTHLERAIHLLLWQVDVIAKGKTGQGDAEALLGLADLITDLAERVREEVAQQPDPDPAPEPEPEPDGQLHWTDFSEDVVGQPAAGWTSRWNPSSTVIRDDPRRMVFTPDSSPRGLVTFDAAGEITGDVEVAGLIRVPSPMPTTRFRMHLHTGPDASNTDSYYVDVQNNTLRINRYFGVDGFTVLASTSYSGFTADTWHNVVLQRRGSALRAKVWPYGSPEPADWQLETTDTNLGSGRVGVGQSGATTVNEWAWFSVGTGDRDARRAPTDLFPAPTPPDAVEGVSVEQDYGFATVRWDEVSGATEYQIERTPLNGSTPSGPAQVVGRWLPGRYAGDELTFADSGFTLGQRYRWRVRAVAGGLTGEWSQPVDADTQPLLGPAAYQTQFEQTDGASWTSHTAEVSLLEQIAEDSSRVRMVEIGRTAQNRPLHLMTIGYPSPKTPEQIAESPSVLLTCTIHGTEPAAREGCLVLLRQLAFSDDPWVRDILDDTTILMVPTVNPDGRAVNSRENSTGTNLNRDNLMLRQPETFAVAEVIRDHKPDMVIDGHEYQAADATDVSAMWGRSPNVGERLWDLAQNSMTWGRLFGALTDTGWWPGQYPLIPDGTFEGTTADASSLKNSVGLTLETRRRPGPTRPAEGDANTLVTTASNQKRRVYSHIFSMRELLDYHDENLEAIQEAIAEAEAAAVANTGPVYLDGMRDVPVTPPGNQRPTRILNPAPCGYLLTLEQYNQPQGAVRSVKDRLEAHGIAVELIEEGVLVRLAQPYRGVIPYLLDPASGESMVSGQRVYDCDNPNPDPGPGEEFWTDFSEHTAGQAPTGWTSRWNPLAAVIRDAPRRLELHPTTESRALYTFDAAGEITGDVEIAGVVRTRAPMPNTRFQLHLHASGDGVTTTSYYVDVQNTSLRINRYSPSAGFNNLASASFPGYQADTPYHVVLRREGTNLMAKIWPLGQPEPAGWMVQTTNTVLDRGWVGIGHFGTTTYNDWLWFSVATGGRSAPRAGG